MTQGPGTRNFSTREVSRILGMMESRVRELVRSGLCRPARRGRRYAFTFQDLVVLRTAQGLLDQQVPMARVRRGLAALVADLAGEQPLSGLRIYADGNRVAVRRDSTSWNPDTGQTLLAFEVADLAAAAEVRPVSCPGDPPPHETGDRAREEFDRAIDLEDQDPAAAREAYLRALALDPLLGDAYVNLGRIAQEAGELADAARLYHHALECSPDDPVIHFNLALVLEDTRGAEPAAAHYERALALDPDFADAHYNLASLCEQLLRPHDALRHYHAYKKLTETC